MKRVYCSKRLFFVSFLILVIGCLFAFSATASPQRGPAGMAFYTPPSPLPSGTHGDLIWYRPSTSAPPNGPAANSWTIMYHSTDAKGASNVVTGTVLVPKNSWKSFTPRPIITYAIGTHGLSQSWAASIQLENGTDYENSNIVAALKMGYAIVISDNPGYTNGNIPTYMAGIAQGHAALDIVKAAQQIPYINLSQNAKVGIWGYSQGGQTAAFAGELQPTYAPDMNLAGVVAGGVPADFFRVAEYLDGNNGSAFLLQTVIGLSNQYPDEIPFGAILNPAGQDTVQKALSMGVFEALFSFMNVNISSYVIGNISLNDIIAAVPSVRDVIAAQELGKSAIKAPLFLYHGTADEFIALNQALDLKPKYCGLGVNTSYMVFPGEHITTQFQAAPYVLSWLKDRFNGKTASSSCSSTNSRPISTANPVNGDFIFSLKGWNLNGKIHLKTLNQDVTLPSGSTLTADTNMTKNVISGNMSIPTIQANINVILPLKVVLAITPVGPLTGTASIDKDGILHVHGQAAVNININQVGALGIKIPFKLRCNKPVVLPIDFDGPVSSLGDGSLTFSGTTTFPAMTGNFLFNSLFTTLMSGPGQKFAFTATPPNPIKW